MMNPQAPKATKNDAAPMLRAIVGEEHLHPASAADYVDGVAASMVISPGSAAEIAQILQSATEEGLAVVPRGAGTKLCWGAPPRSVDVVLSTGRLNRVLEHPWADMTVSVEAGCTVSNLQRAVATHGQRLAIDPLWPERATVGGILATNDSGALRVRFGSLRDLVIGITIALPDGTLAKSGGRVVKNVAGYDLPKLITGSFGTLGVITEATFRLHPLPRTVRTVSFHGDANRLCTLLLAITNSHLDFTGLQLRTTWGRESHLDVRFAGTQVGIDSQLLQLDSIAQAERRREAEDDVWDERERLWQGTGEGTLIVKISTLPASFAAVIALIENMQIAQSMEWRLVAHSVGTAWLRVQANTGELMAIVAALRQGLEKMGSTAVIQQCPAQLKAQADVWGPAGDSTELMRMVKKQFDPSGTLNAGRFVGGI